MEIEKLIEKLASDCESDRRSAMEAAFELPPEKLLGPVADLLLHSESEDVCADCLDLFDRFEASASLADVRMDGWFDQIAKRVNNLAEISAVMGERFLAYAFILNIQIRSLMVNPMSPASTAVHFVINDEQMQTLSLGEFRLRTVQALLHDNRLPVIPTLPFLSDAAVALLSGRTLLVAPLFGITLDRVIAVDLNPQNPRYLVTYISENKFHIEELSDFEERLRMNLTLDLSSMADQPFTLDLYAVERAREAARDGDSMKVIQILEAWPGLLSVLQRTPTIKSLDAEQLALIGEGVCILGEALEKEGRAAWSEELYKLGLQFVRETKEAARLMANLGRLLVEKECFGESIGLLRRSLSLGLPENGILPLLGRAFLKQEKFVAARALLEICNARGYAGPHLESDLAEARRVFDEIGATWDVPIQEIEVCS